MFGPFLLVLLLPAFDYGVPIAALSLSLVLPLLFLLYVLAPTAVLGLLAGQSDIPATFAKALLFAVAIAAVPVTVAYALAKARPAIGRVLKVLLDIILYIGDPDFRRAASAHLARHCGVQGVAA